MSTSISCRPSLISLPNRFLPQVIDSKNGLIAYGSRSNIVLLQTEYGAPSIQGIIHAAHSSGKVTSVSFCKSENTNLLASVGEDFVVKVWDICHSPTCIYNVQVSETCQVVEWKYHDNMIFFPGDGGSVIKWLFKRNLSKKVKIFPQSSIQILSSNPSFSDLLAVGHRGGNISILNVANDSVCYKLRAHTLDIIGFSWSPIDSNMLLSVSKDYTVRLWSLEEPNPKFTYNGNPRRNDTFKFQAWIGAMFHPSDPDCVICSTVRGEVGQIVFKEKERPVFESFSNKEVGGHYKHVFSLTSISDNVICSYGSDFQMIFWDVLHKRSICNMPTIGGYIYDLSFSPLDAGRLAIASGDSSVRVWNVACPSNKVSVKTMWQDTRGKIMVIAWHPKKENILAFATDEGRIGVADVLTYKKLNSNSIFESHHRSAVYSLSWGPCAKINKDSDNSKLFLYSCGGGKVFVHDYSAIKRAALDFLDMITLTTDTDATQQNILAEVSWKLDYSCVAIGRNDGCIDLYSGETFTLISRLFAQKKQIQSIAWHPMFTSLSQDQSPLHTWLACSSMDTSIQVYDLSTVLNGENESVIYKSTRQLSGHIKRVVSLCWSPHIEGQLASASFDGTVQVWNVITGHPVVNFRNHMDCVLSVQWSTLDPDVIFSGGEDCAVLTWKISEQTEVTPPTKCNIKRYSTKKKPAFSRTTELIDETTKESTTNENNEGAVGDVEKLKSTDAVISTEQSVLQVETTTSDSNLNSNVNDQKMKSKHDKRIYKKGLFPEFSSNINSSKEKNLETCLKLVDILSSDCVETGEQLEAVSSVYKTGLVKEDMNFGFFTDQWAANEMLDVEADNHRVRGLQEFALHLELWKGNVKGALSEAAERGELNDFLVSMAPLASRSLWLEMCEKYAMQLLSKKSYLKASQYLLACHKLYQAIEAIAEQGYMRDAVALAKARLPESDPVITQILQKWALKLYSEANYCLAAECFMAIKQPLEAAKALCRAPDCQSAEVAAYICYKFNLKEEQEFSLLCLKRCLLQKEYKVARSLVDRIPNMKIYGMLVAVHGSLSSHIELFKPGCSDYGILAEVFPRNLNSDITFWRGFTIGEDAFIRHLYFSLKYLGLIPSNKEDLLIMHKDYHNLLEAQHYPQSESEALFLMALHSTECLILILFGHVTDALKNLESILSICYSFPDLFIASLHLFLPADLAWNHKSENLHLKYVGNERNGDYTLELFSFFTQSAFPHRIFKTETYEKEFFETSSEKLILNLPEIRNQIRLLEQATIVDSILAYYATNVAKQLLRLVVDNNLKLPCKAPELTSSSNDTVISDALTESVTNETDMDSINDLIRSVLKEADEKIDLLSGTSLNSNGIDSFNVSEGNSEGLQKCSELATISLLNEETAVEPKSNLSDQSDKNHDNCLQTIILFHKLLVFVTSYVCRDMFTVKYFLQDLLGELEASVAVAVANQRFKTKPSPNKSLKKNAEPASKKVRSTGEPKENNSLQVNLLDIAKENVDNCQADVITVESPLEANGKSYDEEKISDGDNSQPNTSAVQNQNSKIDAMNELEIKSLEQEPSYSTDDNDKQKENDDLQIPFLDIVNRNTESDTVAVEHKLQEHKSTDEQKDKSQIDSPDGAKIDVDNTRSDATSVENESLNTNASSKESAIEFSEQMSTDTMEKNDESKRSDASQTNAQVNDSNYSDTVDSQSDTVVRDSVSDLQDHYQKIYQLATAVEETSKHHKYPNPLESASVITSLCLEVHNRSSCRTVQKAMHEYIHSIVKWAEKYSREDKCYIKCFICTQT